MVDKSPSFSKLDVIASSRSVTQTVRAEIEAMTSRCDSLNPERVVVVVAPWETKLSMRASMASNRAARAAQRDSRVATAVRRAMISGEVREAWEETGGGGDGGGSDCACSCG